MMSDRLDQLHIWISEKLGLRNYTMHPASEDASFRRYYRLQEHNRTFIIMDAPTDRENSHAFIDVSQRLQATGLNVPVVHASDLQSGFLLLTDLGNTLYLDVIEDNNVQQLYADALDALRIMQQETATQGLPVYDENLLMKEMSLFSDWLLTGHLDMTLDSGKQKLLEQTFFYLKDMALEQPRTFVHRDYHSRNLMVCPKHNPGILDFQDAVFGPVTYDLVSLLKDCYIKWPRQYINKWARHFFTLAGPHDTELSTFMRWFDLMGVQRHLKASGIFARLCHRDQKTGFIKDIPRTLSYILDLEDEYPQLHTLIELIRVEVLPALEKKNGLCVQ
jgi:N-acetylmuramate 1-kinase